MKKTFSLIIWLLITITLLFNINTLSDYLADFLESEKKVAIASSNDYLKNYYFDYVSNSDDYVPYSYQDLLDIIYSTLNNGWETFTFYCPDEYTDCLDDITEISKDTVLLSNINNYVHPFNSYSKIGIASSNTGEITINVTRLYSNSDIEKINKGVDEIITNELTTDMTNEDKILKIHDYIINNTRYDVDKSNDSSLNALGPLFNGYAVCSGYADLMAIFLSKFGINNFKVSSDTHVWNAVLIDDEWLHLDLTWDDPITNNNIDILDHNYFLIDTNKLLSYGKEEHNFNQNVYKELKEA